MTYCDLHSSLGHGMRAAHAKTKKKLVLIISFMLIFALPDRPSRELCHSIKPLHRLASIYIFKICNKGLLLTTQSGKPTRSVQRRPTLTPSAIHLRHRTYPNTRSISSSLSPFIAHNCHQTYSNLWKFRTIISEV